MDFKLNLQMFAEEGPAAESGPAGAETASAAGGAAERPVISQGDTLPGGGVASAQVAAAMNRQMERHPELRKVYGQKSAEQAPAAGQNEPTMEDRWNELKKGEFAQLYGRDVQAAIQDRFKNMSDVSAQLNALQPMLKVLRDRAGVQSDQELIRKVMDDDSLYEDAANEAGMTIPAYKQFMQMKAQRDRLERQQQEDMRDRQLKTHVQNLVRQAEEFKKQFPGFDLEKEVLQNDTFRRLTSQEVGLSVRDAYFAIHHDELAPQMMAYGMQRAKQQMGQTIQAQQRRPAEGAMKAQGQSAAAEISLDPRKMTRAERNRMYDYIHKKGTVRLD